MFKLRINLHIKARTILIGSVPIRRRRCGASISGLEVFQGSIPAFKYFPASRSGGNWISGREKWDQNWTLRWLKGRALKTSLRILKVVDERQGHGRCSPRSSGRLRPLLTFLSPLFFPCFSCSSLFLFYFSLHYFFSVFQLVHSYLIRIFTLCLFLNVTVLVPECDVLCSIFYLS